MVGVLMVECAITLVALSTAFLRYVITCLCTIYKHGRFICNLVVNITT